MVAMGYTSLHQTVNYMKGRHLSQVARQQQHTLYSCRDLSTRICLSTIQGLPSVGTVFWCSLQVASILPAHCPCRPHCPAVAAACRQASQDLLAGMDLLRVLAVHAGPEGGFRGTYCWHGSAFMVLHAGRPPTHSSLPYTAVMRLQRLPCWPAARPVASWAG